jgi:hypothetical protein
MCYRIAGGFPSKRIAITKPHFAGFVGSRGIVEGREQYNNDHTCHKHAHRKVRKTGVYLHCLKAKWFIKRVLNN